MNNKTKKGFLFQFRKFLIKNNDYQKSNDNISYENAVYTNILMKIYLFFKTRYC